MSTASGVNSSNQPQRTSHQPGPLTILAATAIGGVIATRMGKTPFLLAAGAAALALLKQRKAEPPAPMPQSLPPAEPELEMPAQSQVEQWLSRQIIREEQAPVVEFLSAEITPDEPEDDYHPQSFILDDVDEVPAFGPSNDSFARLADPVPQPAPAPETPLEQEALPPPAQTLEPLHASLAVADAAWTLGVEPLPSLNESAHFGTVASSMFFTAPERQEDIEPSPILFRQVFEGAALPDEIQVAPAFEPLPPLAAPPPDTATMQEPEPVNVQPSALEPSPEIPVEIAAPGEASFDPPLAALTHNPWQTEPEVFTKPQPTSPTQTQAMNPVVEAEIILRPRAPTQNTVITKSKFAPPAFGKHFPTESSDMPPTEAADNAPFPSPLQTPREPRPSPTWRSWWRGD